MYYTKEQVTDLIEYLSSQGGKECSRLVELLRDYDCRGFFNEGVGPEGPIPALAAINCLKQEWPEVSESLFSIPNDQLPTHINEKLTGIICAWRLKQKES